MHGNSPFYGQLTCLTYSPIQTVVAKTPVQSVSVNRCCLYTILPAKLVSYVLCALSLPVDFVHVVSACEHHFAFTHPMQLVQDVSHMQHN